MELAQSIGRYTHLEGAVRAVTRARTVSPGEIGPDDIRAWGALEAQALHPNAYMSPHFVLPALRHLDRSVKARILLIERVDAGTVQAIAVAVTRRVAASRLLPVPHHSIYLSPHSYLGAPLVHREFAAEAANALFDGLSRHRWSAAGLVVSNIDPAGPLLAGLREAWRSHALTVHTALQRQRAILIPAQAGPDSLRKTMQKKHNDLERRRRRLAEQGELQWLIHREGMNDEIVESFLRLEHSGWKAESQTSLRSRAADEAFFREMVAGFASEGRALFTELRLNGQTIASTSNFVSGQAGFAFKVGWDEAYRKYSVGVLNEAELVHHAPKACADLTDIDSGSAPDSFIEMLWPNRRTLVTAFLPFSLAGELAWRATHSMRSLRHSLLAVVKPSHRAAGAAAAGDSPNQVDHPSRSNSTLKH